MGGCHHGSGDICINCDDDINYCCGEDHLCDECGTSICRECFDECNKICPVCSKDIVTDKQLLTYILEKFKLDREALVEEFRNL